MPSQKGSKARILEYILNNIGVVLKSKDIQAASGGGRTFPQIVIDGEPLGGFDRLRDLDRAGGLAHLTTA